MIVYFVEIFLQEMSKSMLWNRGSTAEHIKEHEAQLLLFLFLLKFEKCSPKF
jgi:hypothetical protein